MGKASITIDVTGRWTGGAALKDATNALGGLNKAAGSTAKAVSSALASQESNYKRMARMAASTSASTAQGLAKVGEQIVQHGADVYAAGEKMRSAGDAMTAAITLPMMAIATYSGRAAVTFDTAMANVRKVTDMTSGELQKLGDRAIEMSKTQPVTAETILNVEALGAQFGIADSALEGFATTVTGLDIATNMNAEQAATQMSQFKNIVRMADGDMGRYGSTIVELGNNFSTTESKISATSLRFASAGKQAGLSEAQILGLSAAMSSMGIEAEMGGSALSQVFAIIGKSVAEGGDKLQAFAETAGMSADDFKRAWQEDAMGAFDAILKGVASADDMNVALADMGITAIRQTDVMRRLAGHTELVESAVTKATGAWEKNTALQAEVDQRNESMASRLQVLRNRIDAIAIQVGVPLVNALIAATDAASPVIEWASKMADGFAKADESTQKLILGFGAAAAAAGPVLSVGGRMLQLAGTVTANIGNLTRDTAAVSDAMNTLDGSQMRVYNSGKNTAAAIGLQQNAAVRAAGSVENYVSAWERDIQLGAQIEKAQSAREKATAAAKTATDNLSDALAKLEGADSKSAASAQRSYDAAKRQSEAKQAHVAAIDKEIAALSAERSGVQANLKAWSEGTRTADSVSKSTSGVTGAFRKAAEGSTGLTAATKGTTAALKAMGTGAMKTATSAGSNMAKSMSTLGPRILAAGKSVAGFAGSLAMSIGPQIALTAAVAGITAIMAPYLQRMQEAKDRQDRMSAASETYADIAKKARDGASSQAEGLEDLAAKVRKTTEDLGDLNEETENLLTETYSKQSTLDEYVKTIERLSGQSQLTATDQERLATAVKGYNEITGDSIEITDKVKGSLNKSTDEIKKNAEAWKRNAEAQALQQQAQKYFTKQVEAQLELVKANDKVRESADRLAKAQKQYSDWQKNHPGQPYVDPKLTQELKDAEKAYEDAQTTADEARGTFDSATKSYEQMTTEAAKLALNLPQQLKTALDTMPRDMQGAGVDIAAALARGVEAGKVDVISAANFLSTSVVDSVEKLPEGLRPLGLSVATNLAQGMESGKVKVEDAAKVMEAVSKGDFTAVIDAYAAAGAEIPAELARQINIFRSLPKKTVDGMSAELRDALMAGDVEKIAALTGRNIDAKLAEGIKTGNLTGKQMQELNALLTDSVEDIKKTLDGFKIDGFADGLGAKLSSMGVDIDAFSRKLADAGVSTQTLNAIGGESIADLAEKFNGNVDAIIAAISSYNNTPMKDKDGKVDIDTLALTGANDEIYKWNSEGQLVDKKGKIAIDGTELEDATGKAYVWNGIELMSKEAYAKLDSLEIVTGKDRAAEWNNGTLEDKSSHVSVNTQELTDAQGQVWTWNGEQFVNKETDVKVDAITLKDTLGDFYEWNGTKLKKIEADVGGTGTDSQVAFNIGETGRKINALASKSVTADVSGTATDMSYADAISTVQGAMALLTDKTAYANVFGNATDEEKAVYLNRVREAVDLLQSKDAYANLYGTATDPDVAGTIDRSQRSISMLSSRDVYANLYGTATDPNVSQMIGATQGYVSALTGKDVYANVYGTSTDGTAYSGLVATKGAVDAQYSKTTYVASEGNVITGYAAGQLDYMKGATDRQYSKVTDQSSIGNVITGYAAGQLDNMRRAIDQQYSKSTMQTANGNAANGNAAGQMDNTKRATDKLYDKHVSVDVWGNFASAADSIWNLGRSIANLAGKTIDVVTNNISNVITRHAEGGIRPHAAGGIAKSIVPLDVVGEDGAEAIVPLTNRRYAMPFVRMISEETMAQMSRAMRDAPAEPVAYRERPTAAKAAPQQVVNNYSLSIDGRRAATSQRAERLISALMDEYAKTADMGVGW